MKKTLPPDTAGDVAVLLAEGQGPAAAAERAGLSVAELRAWSATAEGRAALNAARLDRQAAQADRLRHLAGQALDCLGELLADRAAPAPARLAAARAVLSAVRLAELPALDTKRTPAEVEAADRRAAELGALFGGL